MTHLEELLDAHLEAPDPECRWCFAIDMVRIKGEVLARHMAPDAMVLHISCPRCKGEFSHFIQVWSEEYALERISHLHPDLDDEQKRRLHDEMKWRMYPETPWSASST